MPRDIINMDQLPMARGVRLGGPMQQMPMPGRGMNTGGVMPPSYGPSPPPVSRMPGMGGGVAPRPGIPGGVPQMPPGMQPGNDGRGMPMQPLPPPGGNTGRPMPGGPISAPMPMPPGMPSGPGPMMMGGNQPPMPVSMPGPGQQGGGFASRGIPPNVAAGALRTRERY